MVTIVIVSALSPYQELKTFKSGQISKEKNGKYLHWKQHIGNEFCIHPSPKEPVGLRLATLALTQTYGVRKLPSTGPMMTNVEYTDGKAIVAFDNARAGLFPTFEQLEGFEIAEADKKFYPAKAKVVGRSNKVEVQSEQVPQPIAVRYAFRNYVGNITLRNTFGLSAFPFRTDTWDDVK